MQIDIGKILLFIILFFVSIAATYADPLFTLKGGICVVLFILLLLVQELNKLVLGAHMRLSYPHLQNLVVYQLSESNLVFSIFFASICLFYLPAVHFSTVSNLSLFSCCMFFSYFFGIAALHHMRDVCYTEKILCNCFFAANICLLFPAWLSDDWISYVIINNFFIRIIFLFSISPKDELFAYRRTMLLYCCYHTFQLYFLMSSVYEILQKQMVELVQDHDMIHETILFTNFVNGIRRDMLDFK